MGAGLEATSAVGSGTSIVINAYVPQTGLEATGGVGTVSISAGTGIDVDVTGLEATGGVTEPSIIGDAPNVAVTGVAGTGTIGTITAVTYQVVPVSGNNLAATGLVGTASVDADAIVNVTGLSTSASVGSVLVYGNIIPAPGTSWTGVTQFNSTWSEEQPSPTQRTKQRKGKEIWRRIQRWRY